MWWEAKNSSHCRNTCQTRESAERNRFRVCKHREEAQEKNSRVIAKSSLQVLQMSGAITSKKFALWYLPVVRTGQKGITVLKVWDHHPACWASLDPKNWHSWRRQSCGKVKGAVTGTPCQISGREQGSPQWQTDRGARLRPHFGVAALFPHRGKWPRVVEVARPTVLPAQHNTIGTATLQHQKAFPPEE